MEVKHIQSFFKSAGDYSCYADCIARLAMHIVGLKPTIANYCDALEKGIDRGYVDFDRSNYLSKYNFYVTRPDCYLSLLTGKKYSVRVEEPDYICKKGEYEVKFFAMDEVSAKEGKGHFIYNDEDTIQDSRHRKFGKCYSKRVFKEL